MASIELVKFPDVDEMNRYFNGHPFAYPWNIIFYNQFEWMFLKDITILYGNNGSGKSTILKLINSKINNVKSESEIFSNDSIIDNLGIHNSFLDMVNKLEIRNYENEYGEKIYPARIKFIAKETK